MKVPVQYVALETITGELVKDGNKELKPLEDNVFTELLQAINTATKSTLEKHGITLDDNERVVPLIKRINNLNSPPNSDKLSKPFELIGYTLSEDERSVIKKRDRFLHGGTIGLGVIDDDFKALFHISLRLHFLLAVLILKKAGFSGRIINHAKLYDYITEKFTEEEVLKSI